VTDSYLPREQLLGGRAFFEIARPYSSNPSIGRSLARGTDIGAGMISGQMDSPDTATISPETRAALAGRPPPERGVPPTATRGRAQPAGTAAEGPGLHRETVDLLASAGINSHLTERSSPLKIDWSQSEGGVLVCRVMS
jgi:hypothetical protein